MKAIVAGLGACVYDTLIRCAAYPEEDKKVRADGVFRSGGGPVQVRVLPRSESRI
mgnify:CR=1 FL=1